MAEEKVMETWGKGRVLRQECVRGRKLWTLSL